MLPALEVPRPLIPSVYRQSVSYVFIPDPRGPRYLRDWDVSFSFHGRATQLRSLLSESDGWKWAIVGSVVNKLGATRKTGRIFQITNGDSSVDAQVDDATDVVELLRIHRSDELTRIQVAALRMRGTQFVETPLVRG